MLHEIRVYQIKPGRRDEFDELMRVADVTMRERFGMDVVRFGPSLHDHDSYLLVRAFASLADRAAQHERFYGSAEWRDTLEEPVMDAIATYTTAVVDVSDTVGR